MLWRMPCENRKASSRTCRLPRLQPVLFELCASTNFVTKVFPRLLGKGQPRFEVVRGVVIAGSEENVARRSECPVHVLLRRASHTHHSVRAQTPYKPNIDNLPHLHGLSRPCGHTWAQDLPAQAPRDGCRYKMEAGSFGLHPVGCSRHRAIGSTQDGRLAFCGACGRRNSRKACTPCGIALHCNEECQEAS